jgi:hypothetical protein
LAAGGATPHDLETTCSSLAAFVFFSEQEQELMLLDEERMYKKDAGGVITTPLQQEYNFKNFDIKFIEALAIAYFNAGVESEYLGCFETSYHLFQKGLEVAKSLSVDHYVATSLKDSCHAVVRKIVYRRSSKISRGGLLSRVKRGVIVYKK